MGQVVRNNNFFGCGIGILLTDQSMFWSNYQVTNCEPRTNSSCYVPQINKQVYNNNVYATAPNQVAFKQHYVYSNGQGASVDFGNSYNNKFFHPTNPSNTVLRHFDSGITPSFKSTYTNYHAMTLTEWQQVSGEDMTSASTSGVSNLAPAATRGRIIVNDTFQTKTFSVSDGTLETCLYKLDGTVLGNSILLDPMTSIIVEKGTGTGCN